MTDLSTGEFRTVEPVTAIADNGPATRPLRVYEVQETDGNIRIRL